MATILDMSLRKTLLPAVATLTAMFLASSGVGSATNALELMEMTPRRDGMLDLIISRIISWEEMA